MPPFLPSYRSRVLRTSPSSRSDLIEIVDKPRVSSSLQNNKAFLDGLGDSESGSSLSDAASDQFEDALSLPPSKRRKVAEDEEDECDVDWEDAVGSIEGQSSERAVNAIGDLEITLGTPSRASPFAKSLSSKHGPSKIQRQIRMSTHRMHVQLLMFHNMIRSGWAADMEVHEILLSQLPINVNREISRWRIHAGQVAPLESDTPPNSTRRRAKSKADRRRTQSDRDWGIAERQEIGAPDLSRGDPTLRLLRVLAAYWKKKFTVTAPGLRKQGYKPLAMIEEEIASFRSGKHCAEEHGERINGIQGFRKAAKHCEGSRDIGAQLFTALLRALKIETRLVASLQPLGFGWTKNEEASDKKSKRSSGSSRFAELQQDASNHDEEIEDLQQSTKDHRRKKTTANESTIVQDLDVNEDLASLHSDHEDDDSVIDVTSSFVRTKHNMEYDTDLAPTYWSEVISPVTNIVHPVDALVLAPAVTTSPEQLAKFEPRGARADKAKQIIAYVIAYSADGSAKDVTTRYLKRHVWPGKTKGWRVPIERFPIHNRHGKVLRQEEQDWFTTVLRGYRRSPNQMTAVDELEEQTDLKVSKPVLQEGQAVKDTLQYYKSSAEFVLERHLRREEAIRPNAKPVKKFSSSNKVGTVQEDVYRRGDVEVCRTGESWHKEGRAIKPGQEPWKLVPVRAVTLTRKREVEEAERDSGEKLKQGLYSRDQTDWIIPPPIQNGVIPKNAYNNIDCFVPTMVPKGAAHVPYRSTVKVCKRLGIDYAEAVTGFEFGNKMAVPIITGVVVAVEHEQQVLDEWGKDEAERRIKEAGKRESTSLATWKKWLMGLRIVRRVREEYGDHADAQVKETINPFTNTNQSNVKGGRKVGSRLDFAKTEGDEDKSSLAGSAEHTGGGFLLEESEDKDRHPQDESELVIEANRRNDPLQIPNAGHQISISPDLRGLRTGSSHSSPQLRPKIRTSAGVKAPVVRPLPLTQADGKERRQSSNPEQSKQKQVDRSPPAPPSRQGSKRKASHQSKIAIRSHYFDHHSDDEANENINNCALSQAQEAHTVNKRSRGRAQSTHSRRYQKG